MPTDDIKARLREFGLRAEEFGVRGDADLAQSALAAIEALEDRVRKLTIQTELQQREVYRWVPCPDHRDKVTPGACLACKVETLEEANRIRQKMLHYIAFVLTGDENGDAQSAADRVQERIETLEGERDELREIAQADHLLLVDQLAARDAEIAHLRTRIEASLSHHHNCEIAVAYCTCEAERAYEARRALTTEVPK